jgi:hypothetical protein
MTLSQVHSKLLLFEAQAKEQGLSEVQASRLFGWWLNCPREDEEDHRPMQGFYLEVETFPAAPVWSGLPGGPAISP